MKRLLRYGLLVLFLQIIATNIYASFADTLKLKPKAHYGKEAQVTAQLLDAYHFRRLKLNDSLSTVIFDAYFKTLDANKSYFLQADYDRFKEHRESLDDFINNGNVQIAFDIYNLFGKRFRERMDYIMKELITYDYDFDTEEKLELDRSEYPWELNTDGLNNYWKRYMKNQVLSLKLTGKSSDEITDILTKRFDRFIKNFEQTNSEDVFNIFMNTFAEAYDPHTGYFSPRTSDLFKQSMSLSLEGIGARLQTDNDYTKVVEVLPGGPAEKSKQIFMNDRIIGVAQGLDGEMVDVIGWRIDDVVKLIKGPKGTTVRLSVLPSAKGITGPPEEITLVRDKVKLEDQAAKKQVFEFESAGKKVKMGVISIPTFYMDFEAYQRRDPNYTSTTRDVKRLIEELNTEGINGLIIDLRNNGGGSLAEAIDLTGLFIKNGPVVQVRNSLDKVKIEHDTDTGIAYDGPLVVMTNRMSASASEIFAGAIQDYERGIVVGESTFGKGTVQNVIDLARFVKPDDASESVGQVKITLQKFYRVSGSSTQNEGVSPHISLPSPYNPNEYGESSNPGALPWDQIKAASFQSTKKINAALLSKVMNEHNKRLKNDQDLQNLVNDTEITRGILNQKYISLNESVRKLEMEEAEKRRSAATNLETNIGNLEVPVSSKSANTEVKDPYLNESLKILSDLITFRIG
ncbi:MAG TPA: carboxy terminal-processing peptidase [Cyclobacteriaceae bacterium]|nr:carboxy terminal-processing peptidase [Cyclobacteriaceae bacterium]